MAKPIVVSHGGALSQLDFAKVDRSKLYGRRRRVALDPDGAPCTRASLTDDGSTLLRAGMTAQGYFDDTGTWLPNKELVGLDDEGEPLEKVPSTLGEAQPLTEAKPEELLDLRVHAVYALTPTELEEALAASLADGAVYRFAFNYRADYREESAFLIANDEGALFAIVGQPATPVWAEAEAILAPSYDDDDADLDDELDFEMF